MKRGTGWSLVELLIVLVLAAVLLATATASYQAVLQRMQLRIAASDLAAAIDLTRSQALTRRGTVLLAPLDPTGSLWQQGWVVFIDNNGNHRPDPDELRIDSHGPMADGISVAAIFSSDATPAYLAYNSVGRACDADNALAARWGTLSLVQGAATRNIKINMLGRLRVCDPSVDHASCAGAAD